MTGDATETEGSRGGRVSGAAVRRVLTSLGVLLLIAAVVPFVIFAVPQVAGADHSFVILSGSMEPALSPGDVVIVAESASVGVRDVITFDDGKEVPTTHRVIGVEDGQYVTQGDANENADGQPVAPGAVLGRVTLTIPLIGYVIRWVNTPLGYVSLVLVPIILLLVNELHAWAQSGESAPDDADPPGPTQAIRRVAEADERETALSEPRPRRPPRSGTVAALDVKLTALATGVLFAYALWNLSGDVAAGAAPSPVSVAAATAGLSGLLFALWVMGSAWRSARRDGPPPSRGTVPGSTDVSRDRSDGEPSAPQTDGGRAEEGSP